MATTTGTRKIEIELHIEASPQQVWKALIDPEELARWFPFQAEVQPGEGGSIRLSWGPGLDGRNAIRLWDPGRRLQTGWFAQPEPGAETPDTVFYSDEETRRRLLVDYFLEGRGGSTVLRLVHSGFSRAADWDDEFDSHRRGWTFELRSLKHYLEHHRGKTRHVAWVRRPIEVSKSEAWSRLAGAGGLAREGTLQGLQAGDRYAFTTVHGDRFAGEVVLAEAPDQFAGTVDNLGHGLLRFGVEAYTGRPEAMFWLSTWDDPDTANTFRDRWTRTLAGLLD